MTVVLLAGCAAAEVPSLAGDGAVRRDGAARAVRQYVLSELRPIALGAVPGAKGEKAYLQTFPGGTNVLALIPGTDLSGEYVMVGAHHDLANGTGVDVALAVARAIAGDGAPPRRSVIVALWDVDGRGSAYYVDHPVVPLTETVTYLNLDMRGVDVLPSLRTTTFAIGAESGGPPLTEIVRRAGTSQDLHTTVLSAVFGEYRRDHAEFLDAGVPSIFLSDATGPCARSAVDEVDIVDVGTLRAQITTAVDIVRALSGTAEPPSFVAGPALATFDDLLAFKGVVDRAWADRDLFAAQDRANFRRIREDTARLAAEGRAAFTGDDVTTLLLDATTARTTLTHLVCKGFLRPA